jgi:hypothetical protein
MTGEAIIDYFRWLVDDDTVDSTQELALLNDAYDFLCASQFWFFLRSTDTSQTIASGDTTYALPSDFLFTKVIYLRQSATSTTFVECTPVPYEDRLRHLGDATKYYIDQKNSQVVFCSDPMNYAGWLMYHDYQYQPTQLTTSTSPAFNRAFHTLLAFEMAEMYYFNDQGEKQRSWNREMREKRDEKLAGLRAWDGANQVHGQPSARSFNWAPELS